MQEMFSSKQYCKELKEAKKKRECHGTIPVFFKQEACFSDRGQYSVVSGSWRDSWGAAKAIYFNCDCAHAKEYNDPS